MISHNFKDIRDLGYEVQSGPWPFYRIVIACLCWGAINQIVYGPPPSVVAGYPHWLHWLYAGTMLVGTGCILVAIQFMRQNILALSIERFGSYLFVGSIAMYLTNYIFTEGYPQSPNVTVFFAFLVYPVYRIRQLNKEIKEAKRQLRERGL